jgi:hypothetical protein
LLQLLLVFFFAVLFLFFFIQTGFDKKNPDFAVTLRRAFINTPPPLYRTFFLIRHGQSKWNRAMSRINITGMLDKDHSLTSEGINQACRLNAKWVEAKLQSDQLVDSTYNSLHAEEANGYVPDVFDPERMEREDPVWDSTIDADVDDNSSSDDEAGPNDKAGQQGENAKSTVFSSFFMKRLSVAPAASTSATAAATAANRPGRNDHSPVPATGAANNGASLSAPPSPGAGGAAGGRSSISTNSASASASASAASSVQSSPSAALSRGGRHNISMDPVMVMQIQAQQQSIQSRSRRNTLTDPSNGTYGPTFYLARAVFSPVILLCVIPLWYFKCGLPLIFPFLCSDVGLQRG